MRPIQLLLQNSNLIYSQSQNDINEIAIPCDDGSKLCMYMTVNRIGESVDWNLNFHYQKNNMQAFTNLKKQC